ncbi:RNase P modulator RnpM [Chloroflexota bacterium]
MVTIKLEHVPQRTCLGCRQVKPKGQFIRLVRGDGSIELDVSGKKPGRGAYLCRSRVCWEKALKGTHLEGALRTQVAQKDKDKLLEYSKSIG